MRPSSSPKRTANRAIEAFTPKALILNHELRQCFIIGDIGIGKAGLIQPFEKPVKLLGGFGFDPDQDRAEIARRFFKILKPRDIIIGAEKVQKIFERAGPLRHPQYKVFLHP